MFVRVKSSKNSPKKSIQIVQAYRNDQNQVRQRIIRHVGTAHSEEEIEQMKKLAHHIKTTLENEVQPSLFDVDTINSMIVSARATDPSESLLVDLKQLREQARVITGIHEVFGYVYKVLGFDHLFGLPARKVALTKTLQNIVMARIANPDSKMGSLRTLERDFGVTLNLDKVYRMMDKIDQDKVDWIKQKAFDQAKTLFADKIDVVFYDCTTLYFESFVEDELKQNGYSKDGKFNQPHVLLALLVTIQGIPIGYEVYPGKTFEGHTLKDALSSLKQTYDLNKLIFVADAAMVGKDNLALLEKQECPYIISARLKNMDKSTKDIILNTSQYTHVDKSDFSVLDMEAANDRRVVISYSQKRARKDEHDRQKAIDALTRKLSKSKHPASLINNYGYKKFMKIEGDSKVTIDKDKIKQASQWDGLHGVITNIKTKNAIDIINHYHSLWQVEETFRITKHDMRIRPIYHWTPSRVRAHIAICFVALCCIRWLEYRVAIRYQKMSPKSIINELLHVQVSLLKDIKTNKQYGVPSNITENIKHIYQAVDKKISAVPFRLR